MNLESFEQEGKTGFKSGCKIVLPAIYESASYFHDGYAVVRLNGFSGIINSKGETVIPNQYDDITRLFGKYFCVRINAGNDWNCGIIDIEDKSIVEPSFKVIQHKDERYFLCYKTAQSKAKNLNKYPPCKVFEYENLEDCVWYNLEGKVLTSLEVVNSSSSLIVKNEKGKLGVINQSGKLVVDFIYDTIEPCADGVFSVSIITANETSYFVINSESSIILSSPKKAYKFSNGFFYEHDENQKTKWYSITGKLVFEGEAEPLSSDYIAVSKNSKWGVIDKNGEKIINFLYLEVALLDGCFTVLREDKIGLIDLNGKIIVDAIYNSIECVTINNNPWLLGNESDLKSCCGFGWSDTYFLGYCPKYSFDTNGNFDYDGHKCDKLKRNIIKVSKNFRKPTFSISFTNHIDFDLSKPLILVTDEYQELYLLHEGIMSNGRFSKIEQITQICFVVKSDELYGVYRIDTDSLIIPIEYNQIEFKGGHTVLLCKDNLWGAQDLLLDNNFFKSLFAVSIPCENLELIILDSNQTIFGAKKQYKNYKDELESYFTILKRNGQESADFHRDFCLDSQFKRYDNRHFLTSQHGKYGFVTLSGYTSIPFIYDEITERKGGNFNVRVANAWGVIDINGCELIPAKYANPLPLIIAKPEDVVFDYNDLKESNGFDDHIITNGKGLIILQDARSGFHGCMDLNGKEVLPTVFEHLMFSNDENILFFGVGGYCNDKYNSFFSDIECATWGCINKGGKIVIDAKYDCFNLNDGYILGGRDGSMLGEGQHGNNYYESEYGGVYDLFDFDGNLIIGGFRKFELLSSHNLFLFKFGGFWKQDCEDYDEWGNSIYYSSYHFEKGNSRWLAVDKDFNSIILQNNGKKKSFYKHIGTITQTKEKDKIVNYWNMPLEVFSINEPYIDKDVMICGDDSEQYAVRISDGLQSSKYKRIEMIEEKTFFFTEIINGKELVGIASLSKNTSDIRIIDPINEDTCILTYPVNGFVFGISDIDDSNCKVSLYNINEKGFDPTPAISSVNERTLLGMIKKGLLHISSTDTEMKLKGISVIKKDVFDKAFSSLISEVEIVYPKSLSIPPYWYTEDYRLSESDNQYDDNYQDYGDDDRDYMRDTWDVMTDGMYGDMPDGFDGDYDFLGR